ncbi:hypothetical protein [Methylomonas methanica]|uniref:hypothetical protein n=1 Tax=Methylomonas methanica TaxID=421 RepID=UPI0012F6A95D|nr:hypothetical protein [Methylomonas methanica]
MFEFEVNKQKQNHLHNYYSKHVVILISTLPAALLKWAMRHLTQFDGNIQANTESRIEQTADRAGKRKTMPLTPEI